MTETKTRQTFTPGARKTILLPVAMSSSDNGLKNNIRQCNMNHITTTFPRW